MSSNYCVGDITVYDKIENLKQRKDGNKNFYTYFYLWFVSVTKLN